VSVEDTFSILGSLPVRLSHAGLYVCPGQGRHAQFTLDSYELLYVRRGEVRMFEDASRFTIAPDESLILWPGRTHGGIGDYAPNTEFYWVHFHLQRVSGTPLLSIPQQHRPARPERLRPLFHRLLHSDSDAFRGGVEANLLLLEILHEVSLSQSPADMPAIVKKAVGYIDANFFKPISAADVARELGYSLGHLGEVFRAAMNRTLTDHIQQRRLHEARSLILETTLGLKEIAHRSGFVDAGYFSRLFRREEGLRPSEYRAMHAAAQINVH
jgi:AraC-like DNA-binding protein